MRHETDPDDQEYNPADAHGTDYFTDMASKEFDMLTTPPYPPVPKFWPAADPEPGQLVLVSCGDRKAIAKTVTETLFNSDAEVPFKTYPAIC